ncbi:PHB depolymerase family esterase [Sphingomonas sp.]|uniref:extracellular catalytic domain type 1 short-chain-length polyhydroxyalkanoate depolymerase n=1 Tax=Sphingomonas sp. TaxID=28214 RepID=UPI00286E9875|nr:PHB depolymerase family esterase [Sphingomonas sp.]
MRGLHDTVARLSTLRREAAQGSPANDGRLADIGGFGSNPGKLRGLLHVPEGLEPGAALVVVLHGCTQTAALYDRGAGWSELADRQGFAVLYPEQARANNSNLCFNWFAPRDARRGKGEALSIRQMITATVAAHGLDAARVYVTGLSAGGAMTAVMLATYPEVFAGGAVIAGLPFATANSVPEALERMRGSGGPGEQRLAEIAADASRYAGPWPTLAVWHGTADHVVVPSNADDIVAQWRGLTGIGEAPAKEQAVNGHVRRVWLDGAGREAIEQYVIAGTGHGVPLDTRGKGGCGEAGPHMLEAGICSTRTIARSWELLTEREAKAEPDRVTRIDAPRQAAARPSIARPNARPGVAEVIDNALRAAGLMR